MKPIVYVVKRDYLIEDYYEISETVCVFSTKRKAQNCINKMNATEKTDSDSLDDPIRYTFYPYELK